LGGVVWLASYPKSGNTWTRNFLHNLLGESADTNTHDINQMQSRTAWDSSARWYRPFLPTGKKLDELSREEFASIRMQANQLMADAAQDGLVFAKTHNAIVADAGVPMINPKVTAGAVYIIRNPLDVAISYSHHLDASIDETIKFMASSSVFTPASAAMAIDVQGSWSEHVASWTRKPNPAMFIMRYEDMLDDPEKIFSALVNFLRIKTSKQELLDAIEASSFKRLQSMEEEKGFSEKPKMNQGKFFRVGKKNQWQDVLSAEQVQAIVNAHGTQMERFGYLPE
jgi:hypothetical protein